MLGIVRSIYFSLFELKCTLITYILIAFENSRLDTGPSYSYLYICMCCFLEIIRDRKEDQDNDDDDEEDVLINVNIIENESAKERAELAKKKKPGYRAYNDDESVDDFGMVSQFFFQYKNNFLHFLFYSSIQINY